MTRNIVKTIKTRAERMSGRARARSQPGKKPSWHMSSHGYLDVIEGGARIAAALLTAPVLRGSHNRWGATPAEVSATMPGDELVPKPKITSTRAITINAPPHEVWPWLAQIGQSRGGFYSYDALENLARCDIHSADRIIPQLQQLHPGGLSRNGFPRVDGGQRCGRGGRCWVQPKQAGHVLRRHAAVVDMSQYGVAQGPWTLGSWQECLSTVGSCRAGIDRARGLSGNPLGGCAREYAMFTRTGNRSGGGARQVRGRR